MAPSPSPEPSPTPDASPSVVPGGVGGRVLLGRWTTRFSSGPANGGGANIRVPAARIDGTIVKPGQTFQFLDAIAPVTSPPFALGGVLRGGRIDPDGKLGGGMCSASTTLFNAAMRAGLRIVERHAHSLYIDRYPVGLDATVYRTSGDGKDVKFINDTGHRLLIRAFSTRRKVTFEIWGIDDGRTVRLHKPVVESGRPGDDYIVFTDDLAPGQRHRVHDVYDGYQSSVTRVVRDRAGNVISRDTWHSRYRTADGLIEVGRRPGDPAAGTRIPADEYRR
jgi:vancomycin resistance protein YoaR